MKFGQLKSFAINNTLFPQTTLKAAFNKLKFVQADPIRNPARAQDLILRLRVNNYFAGDLELEYPNLDIEEDYLYAYGFLDRAVSEFWHPIKPKGLTKFDKKVLVALGGLGEIHTKNLLMHVGKKSVRNWWGGKSQAAKHSLDILHWWGLVKVVRREKGIRIYKASETYSNSKSTEERKSGLILAVVNILQPVTEKKLGEATLRIRRVLGETKETVTDLIKSGILTKEKIDRVTYIWLTSTGSEEYDNSRVKLLAPFDPLVWDRRRFEHLWGWEYRFEAYTAKEKRVRGYYAMPVLWRNNVIGWANVTKLKESLDLDLGFINGKPKDKIWKRELDMEIDRLKKFLKIGQ